MSDLTESELALLRIVADTANDQGVALVSQIISTYGAGYIALAPDLKIRGYLVRGEKHVLSLTELGQQAIGR